MGLDTWYGLWNEVFQMGIRHKSFQHRGKYLRRSEKLVPLIIYHDQWAVLYNQFLPQEPDDIGGPEAKDVINTICQIVPHSWWIFLFISINIFTQWAHCAHCTTLNVWKWELPRWAQTCCFTLTVMLLRHKAPWESYHCCGNKVAWIFFFWKGNHRLWAHLPSIMVVFH